MRLLKPTVYNFSKLLGHCFSPEPWKGLKDVSSLQISLRATKVCVAGYMLSDVARELRVYQACHKTISRVSHLSTEPLWLQVKKKNKSMFHCVKAEVGTPVTIATVCTIRFWCENSRLIYESTVRLNTSLLFLAAPLREFHLQSWRGNEG